MTIKSMALSVSLGAAAGAAAVLMMPKTSPTRRLAAKAVNKVEDVAWKVTDTLNEKFDLDM